MEDIFVANGYEREEVRRTMTENEGRRKDEEQEYRGVVTVPYVRGLLEQFKRSRQNTPSELFSNQAEKLEI